MSIKLQQAREEEREKKGGVNQLTTAMQNQQKTAQTPQSMLEFLNQLSGGYF